MMLTYKAVQEALDEIRFAYEREVMKWYRIRRQALKRGHTELAAAILNEIERTKHDTTYMDFRDFDYSYKYLFQMDRPAWSYHERPDSYYPGCYGDALDDC